LARVTDPAYLQQPAKKRSVTIAGHATSVTLEEPFWTALKDAAKAQGTSLQNLIAQIDEQRGENNLSSALRLFVLHSLSA
jgi:predicted DNA-binding ribbon-helix-helix protein